ncbi:MAG: hypothetical protein IPJ49_30300 [Candidatus Obscuribacter sp.]|nr:hypothetical protein [Candidatus Obscuribacter sp.]
MGTNTTLTGSTVSFNSTLDSAAGTTKSLTVTGNAQFGDGAGGADADRVGNLDNLASLSVSGTTGIGSTTTAINTTGAQTYTGAVSAGTVTLRRLAERQ